MVIKKKDFVELEYTGKLKEGDQIFDTTSEDVAKKNNIFNEKMNYGPIVICIGEGHLVKGLDEDIEGKETGKQYTVELEPEKAFGKKDPKMLKIVPTNIFKKQKINPFPGLQVNIDGLFGVIKSVSGGRTIVDFNHPFSSKEVVYDYKLNKMIDDKLDKVKHLLIISLNCSPDGFDIKENKGRVTIIFKKGVRLDSEAKTNLSKKIVELVPEISEVDFQENKASEKND